MITTFLSFGPFSAQESTKLEVFSFSNISIIEVVYNRLIHFINFCIRFPVENKASKARHFFCMTKPPATFLLDFTPQTSRIVFVRFECGLNACHQALVCRRRQLTSYFISNREPISKICSRVQITSKQR